MKLLIDIDVPDLSRGIEFYTAAVGLKVARVLDDDVAELTGGDSTIYLLQKPAESLATTSPAQARLYTRHWTPVHVDFVVDDLEAAARRAVAAGARRESECIDWRGSQCITFSDPFGNGFCLIAFAQGTYRDSNAATEPRA